MIFNKIRLLTLLLIFGIFNSQSMKPFPFDKLPIIANKPILIFMTTDWCSICKVQKDRIQKNMEFKKDLVGNFYFINFNPEKYKEPISIFGKTYRYVNNGYSGIHELAIEFSYDQSPVYPTWILLDKEGKIIFRNFGLMDSKSLKLLNQYK